MKTPTYQKICYRFLFPILIFTPVLPLFGQTAKAINNPYPLKPPDTSSPRATMKIFKDYMSQAYQRSLVDGYKDEAVLNFLNRAAECLDLSEIAPSDVQDVGIALNYPPIKKFPAKKQLVLTN